MNPVVFWYGLIAIFAIGVGAYLQDKWFPGRNNVRVYYMTAFLFGLTWPLFVIVFIAGLIRFSLLTRR